MRDALRAQLIRHHVEPILALAPLLTEHWDLLKPLTEFSSNLPAVQLAAAVRGMAEVLQPVTADQIADLAYYIARVR